jgi:hypothetical protein
VGHQNQRAREIGEAVFQHFERRDVDSWWARRAAERRRAVASGGRSARAPARRPTGSTWGGPTGPHRRESAWPIRARGWACPGT